MRRKGIHKTTCSKCDNPLEVLTKRYCRKCNAAYTKEWRKTHPVSEEQRLKGIVRSKTKMRVKRGLLIPYPCDICGEKKVEAHHEDYNKPYEVIWLCFKHHRNYHKFMRETIVSQPA